MFTISGSVKLLDDNMIMIPDRGETLNKLVYN